MEELYSDISLNVRKLTQFWIDMALGQASIMKGLQMLVDFEKTLTEREKDYVDMCFHVALEKRRNGYEEDFIN